MIQAYSGEFTVSPIPLEMSMNYCSHKCAYCFANLNQPGRTLDVNKVINQIKNCHTSKSLSAYLLREGYPILLSNRVDPFANTNWRQTLSFVEMLQTNGNHIAFQTKGGTGIDEVLAITPLTHWYISIAFWNDEIRKKIEPGAPSIQDRISLAAKLLEKGHKVSIGINPLVEEWLPAEDFEQLYAALRATGIKDYWVETLHLNPKQIGNMSAKEQAAMGEDIMIDAKSRNRSTSYFQYIVELLRADGCNVFSINQPFKSSYFDSYQGLKTIKTHQDFINHCFEKYPNGGEIKFAEYYRFMEALYFNMPFSDADGFAYSIARNVYHREVEKPLKTMKDVMDFYWQNPEVSKSLAQNALFSVLSYKEDGRDFEYQCKEDGKLIYYFHGKSQPELALPPWGEGCLRTKLHQKLKANH